MPSKEVFEKLKKKGYNPENDPYLKYDSLAGKDDLLALFEVLTSVKDKNSRPAIFTANCVLANPDFKKIKLNNYKQYFCEPFYITLRHYFPKDHVEGYWKKALQNQIFKFQCHGREHLNVNQWMKALKEGDKLVHEAFNYNMISISSIPSRMRFSYMEGLDYFSEEEKGEKKEIIKEALHDFEEYFGYSSKSFIANCYIWDKSIEDVLFKNKVQIIQGMANQIIPNLSNGHSYTYKFHYTGQRNKYGQRYLVRNAFFEPSINESFDWVNYCLKRISIAFKWGKPAVIGTHRLNYIGQIDEKNRDRNLVLLKKLLFKIKKNWPDINFISSDQVFDNH